MADYNTQKLLDRGVFESFWEHFFVIFRVICVIAGHWRTQIRDKRPVTDGCYRRPLMSCYKGPIAKNLLSAFSLIAEKYLTQFILIVGGHNLLSISFALNNKFRDFRGAKTNLRQMGLYTFFQVLSHDLKKLFLVSLKNNL